MKLTDIKQILTERDLKLTKSLGQNFLHDQNQIRRIVDAAELNSTDKVLEVGPGLGPLTEVLLAHAGQVLAIEKDGRLIDILKQRFSANTNFTLLHADALDHLRQPADWSQWKLVANLPYSVASPILVQLAEASGPPERMVATLQLEVVQRLFAKTGDDDYGLLSLLIQLRYEPKEWFKIPASCFFPAPDVDSGCITLVRRQTPLLPAELHRLFKRIVKQSFSQRRKMMLKLLKQQWPQEKLVGAFDAVGLSHQIRAEAVSLEEFCAFTKILSNSDGQPLTN